MPYDKHLSFKGFRGRFRLLTGMVRANRPWRLALSLSSAIAAASATAAFGVFYSNMWLLSDSLSMARLAGITALAIALFVTWLIVKHSLWEGEGDLPTREETVLYNTATVLTLTFGALCMYAMLFALTAVGASVVIPRSVLEATFMHPVGPSDYVMIAWLASSLGSIAGALGSGLENESAVREAAYSKREQQRRARNDAKEAADR